MTVNGYLTSIAKKAIIRDQEKKSIETSIGALKNRVEQYFGSNVSNHFQFGSSVRKTMLPRNLDIKSDVDYMIVFRDDGYRPQTYLNQIRSFVETKYSRSEIKQSNPSIILLLSHINFELVPALSSLMSVCEYRIPDKSSSYNDWISTSPLVHDTNLANSNKEYNYQIKPLIRILKYWNAINKYPFNSYELECLILDYFNVHPFLFEYSSSKTLADYLFEFITNLNLSWNDPDWKRNKITQLKNHVYKIKVLIQRNNELGAVTELKKLIPLT